MTYDDKIDAIKKLREKLSEASTDFDAWLDTASEQADRIFKFPSLQNRNIDGIKIIKLINFIIPSKKQKYIMVSNCSINPFKSCLALT